LNKPQILIVEDDNAVAKLIAATLEMQDYAFHRAKNGAEAIMEALSYKPDVMLLDLGLPDMDGVEVVKKVRAWSSIPIIVVSARSEDYDKVSALDAGADDYLTKPFSVDELLARLRVALRRVRFDSERLASEQSVYTNGELRIDYAAGCVFLSEEEVHLTPTEYKLLCLLAKNTGKVLTHNDGKIRFAHRQFDVLHRTVRSIKIVLLVVRSQRNEIQFVSFHNQSMILSALSSSE